jgi:hypothetical protein
MREALGISLPSAERASYEQALAALRDTLGQEAFSAAQAAARSAPLAQVIADALHDGPAPQRT